MTTVAVAVTADVVVVDAASAADTATVTAVDMAATVAGAAVVGATRLRSTLQRP